MFRQKVVHRTTSVAECPKRLSSTSLPYKTRFHNVGYEGQRGVTSAQAATDSLGLANRQGVFGREHLPATRGHLSPSGDLIGEQGGKTNGRSGGDLRGVRRDSAPHSGKPQKPWAKDVSQGKGETSSPFGSAPKSTSYRDTPEFQSSPSTADNPEQQSYRRNTSNGQGGYYPTLYRGLSPENLEAFGQSEAEYSAGIAGRLPDEVNDGTRKTLIAPLMEGMIPGSHGYTSFNGTEGSYLRSEDPTKQILLLGNNGDRANELNTKFDNKVRAITTSGMPLLERSSLLITVSKDVQENGLSLSTRSFEDIMSTWSAASLELQVEQHLELEGRYLDLIEHHEAKLADYKDSLAELAASDVHDDKQSGSSSSQKTSEKLRAALRAMQLDLEQEAGQVESLKYLVDCSKNGAAAASNGELEAPGAAGLGGGLNAGIGGPMIPLVDKMVELYYYMRGQFTAPTCGILEHLMLTLGRQKEPSPRIMNVASRLLLDSDEYTVLPSNVTWATYIQLCGTNGMMKHATVRYVDALRKLSVTPCSSMAMAMVEGFTKQGMVEEGLRYIGELDSVEMTTPLVNSILNLMLLSNDPTTVFSAYASSFHELLPTPATYTVLLLACEKMNIWGKTLDILQDMQSRGIKGDPTTLNLLLKGMLRLGKKSYAEQLYLSMKSKRVEVWPTLEEGLPASKQSLGKKLELACEGKDEAVRQQILRGLRHGGQLVELPSNGPPLTSSPSTLPDGNGATRSPRIAYIPHKAEGQNTGGAGAPGRKESYFVPASLAQLKQFSGENKLGQVHPEYLRNFLFSKGVHLRSDWTHRDLVKKTHKELFGVYPMRAAPIVPSSGSRGALRTRV